MPNFILTYHQPDGYVPGTDADTMAEWGRFFETIGRSVVELGQPVAARATVGQTGEGTQLGGYSVVRADNLEAALALAGHCPSLSAGGGVQVGELAPPPDHVASKVEGRLSRAQA